MKLNRLFLMFILLLLAVGGHNGRRWHEESFDRQVSLAVDWNEFRDFDAREGIPDAVQMKTLRSYGATSILLSPTSLSDLYARHRLRLLGHLSSADPFSTETLIFDDPVLGKQVLRNLLGHGVRGLREVSQNGTICLRRDILLFTAVKDIDAGFDPQDIANAQSAGLVPVFRLRNDPWMNPPALFASFSENFGALSKMGVVIVSDDLPGGADALSSWKEWFARTGALQFYMEFHPSKASTQLSFVWPAGTYRAHTIPVSEITTLTPDQQLARWMRAVEERSVRWLLIHVPPSDSASGYLQQLQTLSQILAQQGWVLAFPSVRTEWFHFSPVMASVGPWMAMVLAIVLPWFALQSVSWTSPHWTRSFFALSAITLLGSWGIAALAENPYTRLEIVTFHGVKVVFMTGWLGSLLIFYRWNELRSMGSLYVKRWEVIMGLVLAAFLGYLLVRTGNASSEWQPPMEQSVRHGLETLLGARPRFKEFAIGHPFLLVGLFIESKRRLGLGRWDGRPLMALGMVGQVSIINTFCHLHSPLKMELWRTINGLVLGWMVGSLAVGALQKQDWIYEKQ